jgi:hypothetical protein
MSADSSNALTRECPDCAGTGKSSNAINGEFDARLPWPKVPCARCGGSGTLAPAPTRMPTVGRLSAPPVVYLVLAECWGECGCGNGHILGAGASEAEAAALLDQARDPKRFYRFSVEPFTLGELVPEDRR